MSDSYRYFMHLSFDGSAFHGWQAQKNGLSVQESLEKELGRFLRKTVHITGCGRTDTGVHARSYFAHFDTAEPIAVDFITERMNKVLPSSIQIFNIYPVINTAHARFSALERTYRYYIATEKNPFLHAYALYYHGQLCINAMNEASAFLLEISDFTSFAKLHGGQSNNICDVKQAYWEKIDGMLVFTITANRFLRNMVRAITGTMIDVGRGKLKLADFQAVIERKDRCAAGESVKAKGLFLEHIAYPRDIFLSSELD